MIAPPGTAAAQYYTAPSADFSRPGRTWFPTLGRTRFPIWGEVSTWYHEGVPGHHLQLGAVGGTSATELSRYQSGEFVSRQRRGLGAVRRAADGRARLPRPTPVAGSGTSSPSSCGRRGSSSTSACTCELAIPARPAVPPGRAVDARARPRVPRASTPAATASSSTASGPLPRLARAGHQLQARRAGLAGRPGGGPHAGRCRVRPQGLAHGGAGPGLARSRRPRRASYPSKRY